MNPELNPELNAKTNTQANTATAPTDTPSTPAHSPRPRIRRRSESDLEKCVRVLAEVHRRDGYPVNWPVSPDKWLSPPSLLGAWVAELAELGELGELGEPGQPGGRGELGQPGGRGEPSEPGDFIVGHVGLSRSVVSDLAPGLWSDRNGTSKDLTAVVSRLFVAPQARGHGLGPLLIGRAVEEARGRGLQPVLDVVASDTAAIALYERLGWDLFATVEQRWSPSRLMTIHCYAATS